MSGASDQGRHPYLQVWESSLYRTTTTVIDAGNAVLLVDPNWLPAEIARVRQWIDLHHRGKPIYLLLTHSDFDHILGCGAFPEAIIIASALFAKNNDKERIVREIMDFDAQYYIRRNYPVAFPEPDILIEENGQRISIGQLECLFYLAPGHVDDSIFCLIPDFPTSNSPNCPGVWIAGDYFSNIEIPWIDGNPASYKSTVLAAKHLLSAHTTISLLIPGHGDIATSRQEIMARMENDLLYINLLSEAVYQPSEKTESEVMRLLNRSPFPEAMKAIHQNNLQRLHQLRQDGDT